MLKIGVVMDPMDRINPKKDSTLAMMLAAQARGWAVAHLAPHTLVVNGDQVSAIASPVTVYDDLKHWFDSTNPNRTDLSTFDVLLMRRDPPFDMDYIYATYALERAEANGTRVINRPSSLRDFNEKLSLAWFPQCSPPTCTTADREVLRAFCVEHKRAVFKPLDAMGGHSIFVADANDPNLSVILDTMTSGGRRMIMAQQFVPEIRTGDKRILLINGEPIPYALARVPAPNEWRGNLAAGASAHAHELTKRDRWICEQVGPTLKQRGLVFVGIDVIGDFLTEINVTSPTGIRELDKLCSIDIGEQLMSAISEL